MDIDLERCTANGHRSGIADTDILCEEENIYSPTSNCQAQEDAEINVSKTNIILGEATDENTANVDIPNKGIICHEPHNGLEFESKEAAYYFYREYARSVGFGITIKASRRSKQSGKFIDVKIACSRFGNKPESGKTVNSRSCPKTDCKASMHIKRNPEGNWFVYNVVREHNHEICPDDFCYTIKGKNQEFVIVAFKKKRLQLALDETNLQVLLENLMFLQAENPGFWYSIDFDQETKMRNVLWVDAKGRKDYKDFCDVIIIDTHYVRNKYHIPLVPIVGVNHHFQPILLGCALIGDETASTFVWLMCNWLKAVGGQTPRVVLTDQDKALKEATSEAFPDSHHCFCLWHVLGKIPEKLGYVINRFERFTVEFNECISRAWTEEEFEKGWCKMVERFELGEDEWVQSLYEDRKKWVPTYMRDVFLAGLCTAERSKSVSSFFDDHINEDTTVKEFIDQYKVFLHNRYEEEARLDLETFHEQSTLRSHLTFEKQMSMVYTRAIFEKFRAEVLGILTCNVEKVCEDDTTVSFRVDEFKQHQNFIVTWNEAELKVCCLCQAFEYRGFLCRHALIVLQTCGILEIPSRYILKRWTRNAKTRQITSGESNGLQYRRQRFNDICKNVVRLAEEGSFSQDTYNTVICVLEKALNKCVGVNRSDKGVLYPSMPATKGISNRKEGNISKTSREKKVQKKQKVRIETESSSVILQDKVPSSQEHLNLQSQSFEIPYVPQQNIPAMGLANFGGSYDAQQSTQGVEQQLSSVSSMENGYYTNQRGVHMQQLGQMHLTRSLVGHYEPQQSFQELLQGQFNLRALPASHGDFELPDSLHDMEQSANIMSKNLHDEHLSR